ncbi:DUF6311 domain-containing protein [Clostridium sp. BL-8]|uniref:DUF6311 domain-containing protein n=1 Tax=Clostridium sp. BL-8 TaxID=349938 RepID=UPI00098C600B|nr:DUF6311 domain-containing protein [Clostridium sp. BL-8]OOM73838.1 hypothetical protein CLOBL_45680 [Clostridium sp. BL-8]
MESVESKNKKIIFMLGCLLGAITFVSIYGIKVLNVTYDSWLMEGGDLSQHYIGWKFFRASQWDFPFGLISGLIYPYKVSVLYMDTIPVLSIIFKILSPILPSKFQYFGIWGIFSYMIQGGLGAIIVRKFTKSNLICVGSSMFFLLSPIVIFRMFGHAALGGHWIILLSMYIFINKDEIKSLKKNLIIWPIFSGLIVSIHMYFLPMVMIILICYLIVDYIEYKNILRVLSIFSTFILSALFILFLLGAFVGSSDFQSPGLGLYSANINALFNSQGCSKYLVGLPTATTGQYEGLAYLGLGVILALVVAIYIHIGNLLKIKKEEVLLYIKGNIKEFILFAAMIVFFILSLSPQVSLNQNILFTIPYPKVIIKLLNIFKSTGRFMWPIWYFVVIFSIRMIVSESTKRQAILFLGICVIVQMSDLSGMIGNSYSRFANEKEFVSKLESPIWNELSQRKYKHIVFLRNIVEDDNLLWDLNDYAVNNNMTLNDGYISRKDTNSVESIKSKYVQDLREGKSENDVIYILGSNDNVIYALKNYPLNYYKVDGMIIGVSEKIPSMEQQRLDLNEALKSEVNILPTNNEFLNNGKDNQDGRTINSQGLSYGPYIDIKAGNYTISILGSNLKNVKYDASYNKGEGKVEIEEIERNNEKIVFKFNSKNDLMDFECKVFNGDKDDAVLNKILISKQY